MVENWRNRRIPKLNLLERRALDESGEEPIRKERSASYHNGPLLALSGANSSGVRTATAGEVPKSALLRVENQICPAALGGTQLQCVLEVIEPMIFSAQSISMTGRRDGADAKEMANELDGLLRATIAAQDGEEIRKASSRIVVGRG